MSKQVLIFGAFNPVTCAHVKMGLIAQKEYPDSEIIYIPSGENYLKGWKNLEKPQVISSEVRWALLGKAILQYGFRASDIEISNIVDGRTYNTLQYFHDPVIVLGADKLEELEFWYKGEEILQKYEILVITRDNMKGSLPEKFKQYEDKIHYAEGDYRYQEVSSSRIRKACIEGKLDSVRDFIPECVYDYLKGVELS